ncbi:MAG: hypothetical protein C3L24_10635, partial [Candidatus Sedimenticola endophacoides]
MIAVPLANQSATNSMQALFINPFLHAIQDVMTTMARIDATPDKPTLKRDSHAFGDVTGLIGLSGKQAQGSLAISFPESVILDITRRMIGERQSQLNDTVTDMVGEITNIVSARVSLPRERFWDIPVPKIDSPTRQPLLPRPSCAHHDSVPHIA